MKARNNSCLVLNADYTPLSIVSWKKAITWHMKYLNNPKYGIDILDFYLNDYIRGVGDKKYPIPCIAKTKRFFRNFKERVVFSRKNIFLRDAYTCQYCNNKYSYNELTYDHVIPKSKWDTSKGPATCWTNIVTACINCNRKKANKTPKQANMNLKNLPFEPNKNPKYLAVSQDLSIINNIPKQWLIYLPESYKYA